MLQTETALLLILGFSLASLLALFFLRLMWTAAVRAGARRMQRQAPSTIAALQDERTRLRAENAMLINRLETERAEANRDSAERLAEVNRHRNRLLAAAASGPEQLEARIAGLEQALAEAKLREDELRRALAIQEKDQRKQHRRTGAGPAPAPALDERELRLRERIEKLNQLAQGRPTP